MIEVASGQTATLMTLGDGLGVGIINGSTKQPYVIENVTFSSPDGGRSRKTLRYDGYDEHVFGSLDDLIRGLPVYDLFMKGAAKNLLLRGAGRLGIRDGRLLLLLSPRIVDLIDMGPATRHGPN